MTGNFRYPLLLVLAGIAHMVFATVKIPHPTQEFLSFSDIYLQNVSLEPS